VAGRQCGCLLNLTPDCSRSFPPDPRVGAKLRGCQRHGDVGLADGGPRQVSRPRTRTSRACALDLDFQKLLPPCRPARSFEGLIAAIYQYEVRA
jgi:hypothetical protein